MTGRGRDRAVVLAGFALVMMFGMAGPVVAQLNIGFGVGFGRAYTSLADSTDRVDFSTTGLGLVSAHSIGVRNVPIELFSTGAVLISQSVSVGVPPVKVTVPIDLAIAATSVVGVAYRIFDDRGVSVRAGIGIAAHTTVWLDDMYEWLFVLVGPGLDVLAVFRITDGLGFFVSGLYTPLTHPIVLDVFDVEFHRASNALSLGAGLRFSVFRGR